MAGQLLPDRARFRLGCGGAEDPRRAPAATHYVVNGAKQFISGAGDSDLYRDLVRTGADGPKGISTLVVPKDAPGLSFGALENKMGWHMQSTRQVIFTDCRVPVENLLSGEGAGFRIAMAGLDGGRLNIAACSLGGAQSALDKALAYTGERKAFGQTINQFQALQFRLADMETELQAARIFLYAAATKLDRKAPDAGKWSAMAKRFRHRHRLQGRQRGAATSWRLRLSARLRHREAGARPARPPDPRRHQRDHAGDRRQASDRKLNKAVGK